MAQLAVCLLEHKQGYHVNIFRWKMCSNCDTGPHFSVIWSSWEESLKSEGEWWKDGCMQYKWREAVCAVLQNLQHTSRLCPTTFQAWCSSICKAMLGSLILKKKKKIHSRISYILTLKLWKAGVGIVHKFCYNDRVGFGKKNL